MWWCNRVNCILVHSCIEALTLNVAIFGGRVFRTKLRLNECGGPNLIQLVSLLQEAY
jgi:hypothetical protein